MNDICKCILLYKGIHTHIYICFCLDACKSIYVYLCIHLYKRIYIYIYIFVEYILYWFMLTCMREFSSNTGETILQKARMRCDASSSAK